MINDIGSDTIQDLQDLQDLQIRNLYYTML